ncbi:glutathione-dependent formaldehyde-activating gfa [Stemphylium lycopersici]|nr:glutathione-dependent formaldehyde-activating gfa [Stemphylium lycopersici]RAR00215.1 glutathione-dependent formaldehyde-activating gfa [Stemphylium lycopersici]
MSVRDADKSKPYIPHNTLRNDGWSKDGEATATCYCGSVQLSFPTTAPGLLDTFVCHCTDCRKITASAFTCGFVVDRAHLTHVRGQERLKVFSQSKTTGSGTEASNHFCDTCGTLMYRDFRALPDLIVCRLGTVDDVNLIEGVLKPRREVYVKDRVSWVHGVEGAKQSEVMDCISFPKNEMKTYAADKMAEEDENERLKPAEIESRKTGYLRIDINDGMTIMDLAFSTRRKHKLLPSRYCIAGVLHQQQQRLAIMKFNLSASVKHVAQRLNPDLTIPDRDTKPSPPSSSASASASAPASRNGRTSPSYNSFSLSTRYNSQKKGKTPSPPSLSLLVADDNNNTITATTATKLSKSHSNRNINKGKSPASSSSSPSNTTTTPPSPEIGLTSQPSQRRDFAKARDSITRTEAPDPSPITAASFPAPGRSTWKTVNKPTTPLVFPSPGVNNSGTTASAATSTYISTLDPGSVNSRRGGFGTATRPIIPTAAAAVEMATKPSTPTLPAAPATTAKPTSVRSADKSKPYFPRAGLATDGYTTSSEATATCFCGAVQLSFPTEAPGLVSSFVCNCADCRKITASMFASNFTVRDDHLHHLRGKQNLKAFTQSDTVASGHAMTNHFCCICGSLMYRVGAAFPGCSILRLGTVDDFSLVETKLRPMREDFVKDRVGWLGGVLGEGVKRFEAMP